MEDLRARLEQALAGTHDLERELGGGGMSRTYLAVERNFRRRVVLKVLAPELLAGISVERFHREILLAAQLQHPHIVPVLTAGESEGLPWFTMPYVDGESLRKRLEQGPLRLGEAVSILRDVARALAYAHAQGIVHRDVKPDNVLLSGGSATVTDFGIAKALTAARTDSGDRNTTLTVAGTSLGTPAYMAPEQVAGDSDTDHRADIYSFGVMAYEVLSGRTPFQGATAAKMLAAHLTETPAELSGLRPETPPQLAATVMACLAKDPSDRPRHAAELVRALDTVTASGDVPQVPPVLIGGRVRLGRALALWAAATALVGVIAWAATDVIGLPDWVLPGSVGVMMAGLPVILMTAYVQRVAHRAFTATPQRTPGGTSPGHGTLATLALKASPHVSWRRTWLGGTVAVGAFGVLVLGFMVTRALGIGPAASLRGAGTFGDRETIVVADFRAPAGDSALGPTVSEALRTDLAQSSTLVVLTRASMRELLGLMQRPAETAVQFEVAREIATREGAKAVLDGTVVQLGQSYVISARLVSALDGAELATFRETAESDDELIGALGRLSRSVRERAGESLRTIRASSELERVTTPSLPALRRYVEGSLVADEGGDDDRGLALLQEAVEIDTAFAMAWRKIAVLLGNNFRDRPRALAAISTAYRHRDRLTEHERLLTEGYYFTRGPAPDRQRALAAYQDAARLDTASTSAINNMAVVYTEMRQYERAESLYRHVVRLPRTFGGAFTNLLQEQIRNGRLEGLDSTVALYRERFPQSNDIWAAEAMAAWGRGDRVRVDSLAQAAYRGARTTRNSMQGAGLSALMAALEGRWSDARTWFARRSEARLRAVPSVGNHLAFFIDSAYVHGVWRGDMAAARAVLERGLTRYPLDSIAPSDRPWPELADLGAMMGDAALAQRALAGYDRDQAAMEPDPGARRAYHVAMAALAAREWEPAIGALHEADKRFAMEEREAAVYLGLAFERSGRPDSAIVYYERYLSTPDAFALLDARWRAPVHRALGELYEGKGDVRRAEEQYGKFLDLWQRADPELQPQVREVRTRLAGLRRG